ncbi:hypothetical protein Tco_0716054 [Tanacetum coccineum]
MAKEAHLTTIESSPSMKHSKRMVPYCLMTEPIQAMKVGTYKTYYECCYWKGEYKNEVMYGDLPEKTDQAPKASPEFALSEADKMKHITKVARLNPWLSLPVVQGNRIISIKKLTIVEWHNYKHLDWITVCRDDDKLYTFKEGDYNRLRLQDIKDMMLLLAQGKLTNLNIEKRLALGVSLRMFTRSIVIKRRVEDFQLGIESYQKKLNLTKSDKYILDLKRKTTYTTYSNPRGFIYQNQDKKNRLMRIDELHKFSNGTLNDVRSALDDTLKRIRMKYLLQTVWRNVDRERAGAMIQAIDRQLRNKRIMRSLEKFVGGRLHRYSNLIIQPESEGSTQGYPLDSVEVLRLLSDIEDCHGPSDAMHNPSYSLKNIRVISFTMKMEILLEPTSNKLMVGNCGYGIWGSGDEYWMRGDGGDGGVAAHSSVSNCSVSSSDGT